MKRISSVIVTLLIPALALAGCASGGSTASSAPASDAGVASEPFSEKASGSTVSVGSYISENLASDAVSEDFADTLKYINKNAGIPVNIDYSAKAVMTGRIRSYKPSEKYQDIEKGLNSEDRITSVAATRSDNGSALDVDIYRNISSGAVEKITSTEYGSIGRLVKGWYFDSGNIIYEYEYSDNLYGTGADKKEYDPDEQEILNEGYLTYDAVKAIPGYARVYGYVGDEYGGILENVYVTIKSAAYNYTEQVKTNGDGMYEFYVPVNDADYYNLSFMYGDFVPVTLNDISIVPGTKEYSCGKTYMAAKGENKHETDTYLMNINKKAPDALDEGEYEIVLEYLTSAAQLKPYIVNLTDRGSMKSESTIRVKTDSSSDYKYFVTDTANGKADVRSYSMSSSEARVTVYDRNGIAACYIVPAAHSGVVWEVFEISGGKITPVNNYYYSDTSSDVFFK